MEAQIDSILSGDSSSAIEYTRQTDPRDHYWTLWKLPLFDVPDPDVRARADIDECRRGESRRTTSE